MTIKKYIFCQCMKPWAICIGKNNSYKLDVRDLINTNNLSPYLNESHLNFDFINRIPLKNKFVCRILKKDRKNDRKNDRKDKDENV